MQVKLGRTGLKVNPVGFGGIPIQRLNSGESEHLIETALGQGINFYDTARVYTDSEEKMGRVFGRFPERPVIATKSMARSRDQILRDIETSLKKLQVDHIHLYQCHNISSREVLEKTLGPRGAIRGMIQAREEGMIGHIGVTGHKPWVILEAIEKFPFETIQIPFNFIETAALERLIPRAREKKLGIIAMKPVAGGAFQNVLLNFRFILTSGIDVIIPGMDRIEQVEENRSVLDHLKPLDENETRILMREKEDLGETFCRRCEYCMPCPEGLNIPFLHLVGAYYFRYGLKEWAWKRLQGMEKGYQDCTRCGECVSRCPYDLDIPGIFQQLGEKIGRDYPGKPGA